MEVRLDQTHPTRSHPSQGLGYQDSYLTAAAAVIDGGEHHHLRRWCSFAKDSLNQHQDQFVRRLVIGRITRWVIGNRKCRFAKAGGKEGAVSFELPHQLVVSAHGAVSTPSQPAGGIAGVGAAG